MLRVNVEGNADRYFNVVQDGVEFRVRSISRIIQPNEDTNIFYYKNSETYSVNPGTRFYYQPSRTIDGVVWGISSQTRILGISGIQVRPQFDNEPIVGDFSGTGDVTGFNAEVEAGTEAGRYYGVISPKIVGSLREDIRFTTTADGITDAQFKTFNNGVQYVDLSEGSFGENHAILNLRVSAWFLIYVNGVFSIPQNGGLSLSVRGEYPGVQDGVKTYNCLLPCKQKTILGNLREGYILVYSGLPNPQIVPEDPIVRPGPAYRYFWRHLNWVSTPKLKVFFNSNGYVRLCQWGYEIGADTVVE